MNIFMLDKDYHRAAKAHNNRHVIKMILEYSQILSTTHRFLDGKLVIEKTANNRNIKRWKLNDDREDILYLATHINHPSCVWVRKSSANYTWLYNLMTNLMDEYTFRYGKTHKCEELLEILQYHPDNIPFGILQFPKQDLQAMPDIYKNPCAITAYRSYYHSKTFNEYYRKNGNIKEDLQKPEWLKIN